jgi:hypothetical protein
VGLITTLVAVLEQKVKVFPPNVTGLIDIEKLAALKV